MTVSPMSQGMRSSHVSSYEHSVADRMDTADASARFASCFHEASSQQLAQDASQLLGMVRSSNTPQQNIALIDAAVQDMSGQDRARSCHQPQQQSQMPQALGTIAQQVAGAPEMSDATKNQILGEIAQILSQINGAGAGEGKSSQPNQQLIQALGKIADQIASASGLSDATKNQILGEISQIFSQLSQANGTGPSKSSGAGDGSQAQSGSQDASQLLGLVKANNTPQANQALIDAAVQQLQQAGGQGGSQQSQLAQTLGKIADQVAGASGLSDATKNQILGEITQLLSQLSQANGAGRSQSTGAGDGTQTQPGSQDGSQQSQLAETLGNIADQVAGASGLSDATKNQILGEIAHALSQLQQGGGQASDALSPTTKTAISTLSQDIESALSGNPSLAATINSELSQVLAGAVGAQ